MLKRFAVLLVASFLVIGLLAACGGSKSNSSSSGDSSSANQTLEMTEMKFTPNTMTVKAGSKVTIKLENKGTVTHNFSIDNVDGNKVSKNVDAGKSDTVSFTAPTSP